MCAALGPALKAEHGQRAPQRLVASVNLPAMAFGASQHAIRSKLWIGAVSILGHTLHPLALLFLLSGTLMISRIRIPKL
jgi:CDP-diacylglycerol--serine O-phosphatidyltransferase